MGLFKDVKAKTMGDDAARAIREGRSVFVCRISIGSTDSAIFSGSVPGFAEQIEAVEAVGWRLDQMSFTQDKRDHPQGYFLFRRGRFQ